MVYAEIAKDIIEYNLVAGVRTLCNDEHYEVDDECRESYEWDVENDCSTYYTTGELAGGTCATHIDTSSQDVELIAAEIEKTVKENKAYCGKQVIIAGKNASNDGYFDNGEIRIKNAFVLAVIND